MNGLVPIPNYEGLYSINRKGQVWDHRFDRFLRQSDPYQNRHPIVCLWKNGNPINYAVEILKHHAFDVSPTETPLKSPTSPRNDKSIYLIG